MKITFDVDDLMMLCRLNCETKGFTVIDMTTVGDTGPDANEDEFSEISVEVEIREKKDA